MTHRMILVDLFWTRDKDPRVPLGHASLFTTLRARTSVDVRRMAIAVNTSKHDVTALAADILAHAEGCASEEVDIAIGAYVWGEAILQELLPRLRALGFKGRIILGGPQLTYMGKGLEAIYPDADIFIRGYGEDALCKLAAGFNPRSIKGALVAGEFDLCAQAPISLDALPSPWLSGVIPLEGQKFIRWETQRGCTFKCAFCQHREKGQQLTHKTLNDARVFAEIELFCASGVQSIAVLDPIFNTRHNATKILEHFVANAFAGRLSLQCRAELITDAFLDAAEKLDIGLEFGLQTIHKNEQKAIRRGNAMPFVDETFRKVRERDIDFEVSLIFGLPEQTLDSFKASVDWCLQRRIPVLKAFPLMLLRGTVLDQQRDKWNLVEDGTAMPKVIASSSFSHREWCEMAKISEALKKTEGDHPSFVPELMYLADDEEVDDRRWQPASV